MRSNARIYFGIVSFAALLTIWLVLPGLSAAATPKDFPPPGPTSWEPSGCRVAPAVDPVLGTGWRNLHADAVGSDELDVALVPMFEEGWVGEGTTFNPTGPVFDDFGNLYLPALDAIAGLTIDGFLYSAGSRNARLSSP